MFDAPDVMRMAQELARHSGSRQAVVAGNIANADTPGFRAKDVPEFSTIYSDPQTRTEMQATREGHISGAQTSQEWVTIDAGGPASSNGNTVSVEEELVRANSAQSSHTLALTVYQSSLEILRTALGRGR